MIEQIPIMWQLIIDSNVINQFKISEKPNKLSTELCQATCEF